MPFLGSTIVILFSIVSKLKYFWYRLMVNNSTICNSNCTFMQLLKLKLLRKNVYNVKMHPMFSICMKITTRLAFYCQLFRPFHHLCCHLPTSSPQLLTSDLIYITLTSHYRPSCCSQHLSVSYHLWISSNPVNLGFLMRLPNYLDIIALTQRLLKWQITTQFIKVVGQQFVFFLHYRLPTLYQLIKASPAWIKHGVFQAGRQRVWSGFRLSMNCDENAFSSSLDKSRSAYFHVNYSFLLLRLLFKTLKHKKKHLKKIISRVKAYV